MNIMEGVTRGWRQMNGVYQTCALLFFLSASAAGDARQRTDLKLPTEDGYRGIWYSVDPTGNEYAYKYSGGLGTYPQQQSPIAVYSREANKTFFVYGGVLKGGKELVHMVSYFDHATGTVPRPRVLLNKNTGDAHDNPTLQIDDKGYLWVFSSAHGTARPSYIHRSTKPYSIDSFERVMETNFSYTQPWYLRGAGFLFLHTRYVAEGGQVRALHWMTSRDGRTWDEPKRLAKMARGSYQISWSDGKRVATAFDHHPLPLGLDGRTNLYYLETDDMGHTWKTAGGTPVATPLSELNNPALVHDYAAEKRLVYLKDLNFDKTGRPVILYLTSADHRPGLRGGPHAWYTARWDGHRWQILPFTSSDHNYDHGSLYVEADGTWRVIAPTEPGPQLFGTGGEMVLWTSRDDGKSWRKVRQLTRNSIRNHTYARRPLNAHPDFYALWADGDARKPSESRLYFTNRTGDHVWRLPVEMKGEAARPEVVQEP